jgi:hypothetical protein
MVNGSLQEEISQKLRTNRGLRLVRSTTFINVSLVYRFNRRNYFEYEIWWLDD